MAKKAEATKTADRKAPPPKAGAPAKAAASKPVKSAPAKPALVAAKEAKAPAPTTVTLKHLSATLAQQHELPKKQADTIVADVFGQMVSRLKAGERLRIGGLGILEVKNRPARMGRNPATGAAIEIKASKKVAFRAAKELKEAI